MMYIAIIQHAMLCTRQASMVHGTPDIRHTPTLLILYIYLYYIYIGTHIWQPLLTYCCTARHCRYVGLFFALNQSTQTFYCSK